MTRKTRFAEAPANLYDAVSRAGSLYPEQYFALLDNRGRVSARRSFDEIHRAAVQTAARYRTLGLEPGDRVLVCLPSSWAWLDVWFGAAFNRSLPAAIAPPGALGSPAAQVARVLKVCQLIGARYLIGTDAVLREAKAQMASTDSIAQPLTTRLLDVQDLLSTPPAGGEGPGLDPDPEDIAFLQLTSGSTGLPRAVQISHRAVSHNAIACSEGISGPHGTMSSRMVNWLPLYHDLGLVGCVLNALVNGFDVELLNPRSFLARPWIWLEALSGGDRLVAPAPNFAYQLLVERMADRDLSGLDLSGWRDSMCGSEMIRADTMRSFAETFAPAGFRPEQLRPCYGLAETTLSVSFDRRLEGIRTKPVPLGTFDGGLQEVVSNGTAVIDTELQVRTPAGGQRPASEVGEVWVRGPGLFSGYYNDPDATAEVLRDGWFDTGDLGFLDQDGELYLTGRSKEILILQGTNIMPHDLEWVAEGVAGSGGSQRAGAFSVPCSAGEQAVLVLETTGKKHFDADLRGNIARAIGRELSIPLADVVLVKRGSLPRTSSGKVQRRELRNRYLRGEIQRLGGDQAS